MSDVSGGVRVRGTAAGRGWWAPLALVSLLGVACSSAGSGDPVSSAEPAGGPAPLAATFELDDFSIRGPAQLPAGTTRVTVTNAGAEPHHLLFARLEDGVTPEDFLATFSTLDPTGVADVLGGPNGVAPASELSATIGLAPGTYVLACVIPGPDGVPHVLKGMTASLTVIRSAVPTNLPPADLNVRLDEFGFGLDRAPERDDTVLASNEGSQLHELTVVRLREGASIEEVVEVASKPIGTPRPELPWVSVGGVSLLSPGRSAWIDLGELALPPGRYAFVCFIPSPDDRVSHASKGMVFEFAP